MALAHRAFHGASLALEKEWLPRFDILLVASDDDARQVESISPGARMQVYANAIPSIAQPHCAEQDVIAALQATAKAAVAHNGDEWGKHIADDFMRYQSGHAPVGKAAAIAALDDEKTARAVSEIQAMRLAVYGDGAALIANYVSPDNSRPPYRAASVWAKRNGQWTLVIEVETDSKS